MSTKRTIQTTLDKFGFIIKKNRNKTSIKINYDNNNNNNNNNNKNSNSNKKKLQLRDNSTLTQIFCQKLIYIL